MSSDYIPRLRAELLRAAASQEAGSRQQVPRRALRSLRPLRPVAAAGALALVVIALVFTVARPGGDDDRAIPAVATARLSEQVAPGAGELATKTLRERLAAAGVSPAFVSHEGDRLHVAVPPDARETATALLAPGRFAMYDWEAGVLGSDGRPAPDEPGTPDAGQAGTLTQAEAQARADRADDARVLKAETGPGYFAFSGPAALTNASLASARAATDPMTRSPIVELTLTEQGQRAFQDLTREIAQRGADNALGGDALQTSHHLAIVVDDRILSMPFINWREVPDGIDGALGAQIVVKSAAEARQLAAILNSGPMPGSE